MNERKQINFTIVPDDAGDSPRTYANFCAISHTPFDFTLSFCEVQPLSQKDIEAAEADHIVTRAGAREDRPAAAGRAEPDRRAAGAHAHLLRIDRRAPGTQKGRRPLMKSLTCSPISTSTRSSSPSSAAAVRS